jgi:hypothetical protein
MFFKSVTDILDRASNLNEDLAWLLSIDNGVKEKIIYLNTINQLYDKGIDALGDSLGEYSAFTIGLKRQKGQRVDHITLKDEGDFYHSFRVSVTKSAIIINATTQKDDNDLAEQFGQEIIGLTDENQPIVNEMILINIIKYVKKQLGI